MKCDWCGENKSGDKPSLCEHCGKFGKPEREPPPERSYIGRQRHRFANWDKPRERKQK